jgi:DNA-directed RNA polymerase subunit RPC12/RpoP
MATMPRTRKAAQPAEAAPILIGDDSAGGYISCPSCGRPVADGLVRCSGCGMRILMGVAASRALLFLTTGAVLGLLVGGISVGWIMSTSRVPAGSPAPAVAVRPSPSDSLPPPLASSMKLTVDPLAASALRQVASTDAQLASSLDSIKHELRTRSIDTGAIAATLRAMSAAATYGTSVVGYLSAWPDAALLQGKIGRLYEQVRAVAANGLSAQLQSQTAYQSAANQMISALVGLPAIQAAEIVLGQSGGVDLPGESFPAASPAASG